MMPARTLAICAARIVCSTHALGGQGLSQYRNFELGSNVASVKALANIASSEARVMHQRPAVLLDLEWRPSQWIRGSTAASTDPVEQLRFSFYNDQLFRIVVDYDRDRTKGMTGADLIEAISAVYGTPLPSTPRAASASRLEIESGSVVARWGDPGHAVVLYQSSSYGAAFRLVVTSVSTTSRGRQQRRRSSSMLKRRRRGKSHGSKRNVTMSALPPRRHELPIRMCFDPSLTCGQAARDGPGTRSSVCSVCTDVHVLTCHAHEVKSASKVRTPANRPPDGVSAFSADAFLKSTGVTKQVAQYGRGDAVFTQGDACDHVMYIQAGGIKLSVLSKIGREAVVAMLGPGDFFGEGCLAGQAFRMGTATATTPSTILLVAKDNMVRLLHSEHAMSDRFISHMLARNIRIEEDRAG